LKRFLELSIRERTLGDGEGTLDATLSELGFVIGIGNDRVATHGYGEEFPVASNNNAESRQSNTSGKAGGLKCEPLKAG
jgi:hypothetical protein